MALPAAGLNGDHPSNDEEDDDMSESEQLRAIRATLATFGTKLTEVHSEMPVMKGEIMRLGGAVRDLHTASRNHEDKDEERHRIQMSAIDREGARRRALAEELEGVKRNKTPSTPPEARRKLDSLLQLDDGDVTAVRELKREAIEAAAVVKADARRIKMFAIILGVLVSLCILAAALWGVFQIAVKHAGVDAPKVEAPP